MTKQQQPPSVSISAGSDIVFHQTHLYAALKILNHDQFELSPAAGVVAEQALQTDQNRHDPDSLRKLSKSAIGKSFYLSTARSKVGAFARAKARPGSVSLKLNGAALGRKYKIRPVDYWGSLTLGSVSMRDKRNEQEDRLFSPTSTVPKARRYIMDVHVWAPDSGSSSADSRRLFDLYVLCKKFKIPLYAYDTRENFLLQARKNAIKLDYRSGVPDKLEPERQRPKRRSDLSPYLELFTSPVSRRNKLSKDADYTLRTLDYSDGLAVFQAALHNAKSLEAGHHTKGREALVKLVGIMNNLRLTPAGFIHHLTSKWK